MRAEAQADAAAGARPFFFCFFFLENAARSLSVRISSPANAPPTSRFHLGRSFFGVRRYRLRASEHDIRESSQLEGGGGGEREVSPRRPPKWLPREPPSPCPDLTTLPP